VNSGDLHQVVQLKASRGLTDYEKLYLLNHHFVPCSTYQFPLHTFGKQQRRFQGSWLSKYNGLVCFKSADGGYCKLCVLFAQNEVKGQQLCTIVNRPLLNF